MQCTCHGLMVEINSQNRSNGLWKEYKCIGCKMQKWVLIKPKIKPKFYKPRVEKQIIEKVYITEYTIEFPHSQKKWTSDLEKIINYSAVLQKDCQCIYNVAQIAINNGESISRYDLHAWLLENSKNNDNN